MSNWVHIIGICGVATAGTAIMFKNLGWKVTGSDKGFFPPVSEYLKINGIDVLPGFKPERLTENAIHPNLVIIQGTKGELNPEIKMARELNLLIRTYPDVLREFVVVPDGSVVVVGSFGKSTTTAALVNIFKQSGIDCSYMYGALTSSFEQNIKAKSPDTKFSVIEGDEYIISLTEKISKFFYYSPKYLIITGLAWDHPDVFITEESYFENFKKLISLIPTDGLIVANGDDLKVRELLNGNKTKVVFFSIQQKSPTPYSQWYYLNNSNPLPCFVNHEDNQKKIEIIPFEKMILGQFNIQNLFSAAIMANFLGIKKEAIQAGIKNFIGLKRRLEVRLKMGNSYIIDDFGSSPSKAKSSLNAIREEYLNHKLIAVFEPTAGNRDPKALPLYKDTFTSANLVIFPKFTELPKTSQFDRFDEYILAQTITEFAVKNQVIANDADLVQHLKNEFISNPEVVIVFLGSHSFRNMIVDLVNSLTV